MHPRFAPLSALFLAIALFSSCALPSAARAQTPARWLAPPLQTLTKPTLTCWIFPTHEVKETPYLILIKRRGGNPCRFRSSEDRLFFSAIGPSRRFSGLLGDLIFFQGQSSDTSAYLEVHSLLLGKLLFRKEELPKHTSVRFDKTSESLFYQEIFRLPSFCPRLRSLKTNEQRFKLCWPRIQRTFPSFRNVKLPLCSCSGQGVPSYLAEYSVEITKKQLSPSPTGKISCACVF